MTQSGPAKPGPGPVHANTAHERREKGGLKPDTHKHRLGVWLLLRTRPVRARFPRRYGRALTKSVSRRLGAGCEANTGNGALSGTGRTIIVPEKKREENRRRNGAKRKRLGKVGAAPLWAPRTWWPLHGGTGGHQFRSTAGVLSPPLARESYTCTHDSLKKRPPRHSERSYGGAAARRLFMKKREKTREITGCLRSHTLSTFGCKCHARALTHALCRCSIFSLSPPTGGEERRRRGAAAARRP